MNKHEAAIVSAYTGYLIGSFTDMHEYVETLFGRPVFTHEFGDSMFAEQIRNKARQDYVDLSDKIIP
jgi:hypothetical protein